MMSDSVVEFGSIDTSTFQLMCWFETVVLHLDLSRRHTFLEFVAYVFGFVLLR